MTQFIQLHLLTAYPPSNLNRDDLGRPKTAIVGGTERLRISSQSLKRAWRTSEHFESALGDFIGTRTKRLGEKSIFDPLVKKGISPENAHEWAKQIAGVFGKIKEPSANEKKKQDFDPLGLNWLHIEQLAHIGTEEQEAVNSLVKALADRDSAPTDDELNLLRNHPKSVDIALFGRMLASSPAFNVEAAAQVAHAITVDSAKVEDDFFTAVDDLNTHEEDAGAGHMGDFGFGSGIYYLYICINRDLLVDNLQGDEELAKQAISALVETAAKVTPTGKQNSFASRAYTSYLLAEKGLQQPRALSVAFLAASRGADPMRQAIDRLEEQRAKFDQAYGKCADDLRIMNVESGEGSLQEIIGFVAA